MTTILRTLEHRDPSKLKNHPLNITLYGDVADAALVDSIARKGVLEEIRILPDGTIISGHRRRQAAIINKIKQVPVVVRHDLKDALDIEEALIESNRQREKTVEQRGREYERLKGIEAERAAERQKSTQKSGVKKSTVPVRGIFPSPGKHGENDDFPKTTGKSSDIAAEKVGMSTKTAEKVSAVVKKIDELEAAGETGKADEVRQTLNTGTVAAAARAAEVDPPTPVDAAPAVMDALKRKVSSAMEPVFQEMKWFAATIKTLGALRSRIEELASAPAGARLDLQDCNTHIGNLQKQLKFAAPHTECPECKERVAKTCKICKGCGFIGKADMNGLTAEHKEWLGIE